MREEETQAALFYDADGSEFSAFANFSLFPLEYKGEQWMTAEHAYQASKYTQPEIIKEIKEAGSPEEAFTLGRKYERVLRPDWYEVRVSVMEDIVRTKVNQHSSVRETLLNTGTREIIEASPTDSFWGWGSNKDGENKLGKIWMKLRDEHRKKNE